MAEVSFSLPMELAVSLRNFAGVWSVKHGWPRPRKGESVTAYLERCAFRRPRYDDGEPLQLGDEVEVIHADGSHEAGRVQEVNINRGPVFILSFTGVDHEHLVRFDPDQDSLRRHAPESQELIDKEARLPAREYYARRIGGDFVDMGAAEIHAAVTAHLLKRQRDLDAKVAG